jgi:hypothetical protein
LFKEAFFNASKLDLLSVKIIVEPGCLRMPQLILIGTLVSDESRMVRELDLLLEKRPRHSQLFRPSLSRLCRTMMMMGSLLARNLNLSYALFRCRTTPIDCCHSMMMMMMMMMGFLLARNLNRSYALFRGKSMPKGHSEENSVELISNEETFGKGNSHKKIIFV